MNGFIKFVARGNVVGLAVGVVIGAAFSALVTTFTSAFLTPLIGLATNSKGNFSQKDFTVIGVKFPYGGFLNAAISFLLTALTLYFLVVLPMNKLTARLHPHHDTAEAKRACPECLQQIPAKARRCSFCTSHVEPVGHAGSAAPATQPPGGPSLSGVVPVMKAPKA